MGRAATRPVLDDDALGPPGGDDVAVLSRSALRQLVALAGQGGGWTDFFVPAGPSSSWVSGYAGLALARAAATPWLPDADRAAARATAQRAADALQVQQRDGGWGWSPVTRVDADSTAWAVRLLAATGRPIPAHTWAVLDQHRCAQGYRTYRSMATGSWTAAPPEVTAVVLLARLEAGRLAPGEAGVLWDQWCGGAASADPAASPLSEPNGSASAPRVPLWESLWWADAAHPTALVLAAAAEVGRGVVPPPEPTAEEASRRSVAHLAAVLWARACGGARSAVIWAELLRRGHPAGGWAGDTVVRVPAQDGVGAGGSTIDARGVFTTATVLHAALAAPRVRRPVIRGVLGESGSDREGEPAAVPVRAGTRGPSWVRRERRDRRWDEAVAAVAGAQGVDADLAVSAFRALTAESLCAPSPWPSAQLSVLAAGQPVEFSATGRPGVRFTAEVGDPRLPPAARLRSGLHAVSRAADLLGTACAWSQAQEVVRVLADPSLPVPDGCRFWLWAGVDLGVGQAPVLKVYLSLHAGDVDGWPARRDEALRVAGVPKGSPAWAVLDRMRAGGWGHELGIGLRPDGRWALKAYDELDRWCPDVVGEVLAAACIATPVAELAPEIPGVLRASTRRGRRAGIAVRIDPSTGRVPEVTTATALPVPLVGRAELAERVAGWLDSRGEASAPLRALVGAVAPSWRGAPAAARMLSLVTRTARAGMATSATTTYVRPGV